MTAVCLPKPECPCGADRDDWRRTFVPSSIPVWPVELLQHGVRHIPLRVAAVWSVDVPAMRKVQTRKAFAFLLCRTCPVHHFPSCTTRAWQEGQHARCMRRSVYAAWSGWDNDAVFRPLRCRTESIPCRSKCPERFAGDYSCFSP